MRDDTVLNDASERLRSDGLWPPVSGVYLPDDAEEVVVTGANGFTPAEVARIKEVLGDLPHKVVDRPVEPGIYY